MTALDLVKVAVVVHVGGHVEWGVNIFLTAITRQVQEEPPSSGREYLRRKSAAAEDRERLRRHRQGVVRAAYETLAKSATRSVSNPPQDEALSGRKDPMLLNSAHLLAHAAKAPFFEVVEQVSRHVAPEGMTVEISGPWPPLIDGGVVVTGDIVLSLAEVDLVHLGLRLVLAPAHKVSIAGIGEERQ